MKTEGQFRMSQKTSAKRIIQRLTSVRSRLIQLHPGAHFFSSISCSVLNIFQGSRRTLKLKGTLFIQVPMQTVFPREPFLCFCLCYSVYSKYLVYEHCFYTLIQRAEKDMPRGPEGVINAGDTQPLIIFKVVIVV